MGREAGPKNMVQTQSSVEDRLAALETAGAAMATTTAAKHYELATQMAKMLQLILTQQRTLQDIAEQQKAQQDIAVQQKTLLDKTKQQKTLDFAELQDVVEKQKVLEKKFDKILNRNHDPEKHSIEIEPKILINSNGDVKQQIPIKNDDKQINNNRHRDDKDKQPKKVEQLNKDKQPNKVEQLNKDKQPNKVEQLTIKDVQQTKKYEQYTKKNEQQAVDKKSTSKSLGQQSQIYINWDKTHDELETHSYVRLRDLYDKVRIWKTYTTSPSIPKDLNFQQKLYYIFGSLSKVDETTRFPSHGLHINVNLPVIQFLLETVFNGNFMNKEEYDCEVNKLLDAICYIMMDEKDGIYNRISFEEKYKLKCAGKVE